MPIDGDLGSAATKQSSNVARYPTIQKKVLQYKVFKSLKQTADVTSKYEVGETLGKGSFGEVRQCLNRISGE